MARDIGIDLGTSSIIIGIRGKGILLEEPNVAAYDNETGQVKKFGKEAYAMIGRTPPHISTIRPMRDGVINQYDMTLRFLQWCLRRAVGSIVAKPHMMICVPSGITEVEERALVDAATQAGASKTTLIEEPIAAAIGAGIEINAPKGIMIVDIGGGTTDIAVISMGGIVTADSIKCGGDKFDDAIMRYIRKKHNLTIGDRSAEEIKIRIGTVWVAENSTEASIEVRGRCMVDGLPKAIHLSAKEIAEALDEPVTQIMEAVCRVVEKIPTELLADITASGIVLTGGGALLNGMDKRMSKITGIRCRCADDAIHCVANGICRALGDPMFIQDERQSIAGKISKRQKKE